MSAKQRVVVLISGSGSNLQAIIDATQAADYPGEICAVISNKENAYGLERARRAGIEAIALNHQAYNSREAFDAALKVKIDPLAPDAVVLAGFMRILTPSFVCAYQGRMLNIHPSLLPKYPGLHTHQRALEAQDATHGVTVHFVTGELDGGPSVLQATVPVLQNDTVDTLAERVLEQEHKIYPLALRWLLQGRLIYKDGKAIFDKTPLPPTGLSFNAISFCNGHTKAN